MYSAIDRIDEAYGELATIARWAKVTTAEWCRALGQLAERTGEAKLWARYRASLANLAIKDFEVVIRQAGERELTATARAAAEAVILRAPTDLDASFTAGACFLAQGDTVRAWRTFATAAAAHPGTRDGALAALTAAEHAPNEHARELLDTARAGLANDTLECQTRLELRETRLMLDSPEKTERLWQLFERIRKDDELLAESHTGHQLTDLVVRGLETLNDKRAIVVAKSLVDAKKRLWGKDAPSTWLEEHNLGTVYAALGDHARGRKLVAAALKKLRGYHGEDHPHVEMAKRSLALIDRKL